MVSDISALLLVNFRTPTIPEGATKFAVHAPFNGEKLCDVVSTDVKVARKVIEDAHATFER